MQQIAAERLAQEMRSTCVGTRIARLHRVVTRTFERELKPVGVSLPQLELLSTLACAGPTARPAELADLLGVERSTMSRNLTVLERNGWVCAAARSAGGRLLEVALTPQGEAMLVEAGAAWHSAQTAVAERLGPDASAVLDAWLLGIDGR